MNLTEALDVNRGKSSGVLISFIDSRTKDLVPYLLLGSVSVVFGIAIYYGLPISLLELNFGLILKIFFLILMGLLLGLVLITINMQSFLELVLMHVFLFWESASMKALLKKNMTAHKRKNKLTAIIYALTLGCIIFLLTSANLQIQTINQLEVSQGVDILIQNHGGTLRASMVDGVLQ